MRILTLLVLASILSAHSFGQSSGSNDLPPCAADAFISDAGFFKSFGSSEQTGGVLKCRDHAHCHIPNRHSGFHLQRDDPTGHDNDGGSTNI